MTTLNQFYPRIEPGFNPCEFMYDQDKAAEAGEQRTRSGPGCGGGAAIAAGGAGPIFDALDYQLFSWPGHGVAETASFQYVEKEWMLPEEYDELIEDPNRLLLRTYIPRTNGLPRRELAKFDSPFGMTQLCGADFWGGGLGRPRVPDSRHHVAGDGQEGRGMGGATIGVDMRLTAEGFPVHPGLVHWAPFDYPGRYDAGDARLVTDLYRPTRHRCWRP